jgi:protein-disulfide isomerase
LEQWQNDSDLFLSHLYVQQPVQMNHLPHEDQIGNPEAPITVTMVSNPHCNPCKEAYKELTGWVKYFEDEMQLRIRHINGGEEQYQLHEKWAKEVGIEFTPTLFINGYRLRPPYAYQDVWKHIRMLAEKAS